MRVRYLPRLLVSCALMLSTMLPAAWAGTPLDRWQVTELRMNVPAVGGWWYASRSPLSRGLNIGGGYVAIYAAQVLPGLQYTLQLSTPTGLQRIEAYLYDRWPLLTGARRAALPSGPVVLTPHARRITYRWHVGISARSTGNLLYVLVRYPRNPARRRNLEPRILVSSPPLSPTHRVGHGVTYLQGPQDFVLSADTSVVSYVFHPGPVGGGAEVPSPGWAVPGDLISNGRFRSGLKNWVPVNEDDALNAQSQARAEPRAGGLHLPPDSAVRQQIDADVSHARSLVLWADVRLDAAAARGPLAGRGPSLGIDICYRDTQGGEHCGGKADRIEFYTRAAHGTTLGRPGGAASGDPGTLSAEHIAAGHWYRYQVDLVRLRPPPAHIDSITLLGGHGAHTTSTLREVHLIVRSEDHVTQ